MDRLDIGEEFLVEKAEPVANPKIALILSGKEPVFLPQRCNGETGPARLLTSENINDRGNSFHLIVEVGTDVDAVSRATITIRAAAREVRDSARMVARAVLTPDAVAR